MTPAYLFEEDARAFHQFWKKLCDKYGSEVYPSFKQWCDDYFYLPARKEGRGIGGIFFDDVLGSPDQTFPNAEEVWMPIQIFHAFQEFVRASWSYCPRDILLAS